MGELETEKEQLNDIDNSPKEPTLKEKTAKGLFWSGTGSFFQQIIGLIFGILIARILSPNDYGLISMLSIFIAIANSIMDSGFTTALINKKEIKDKDYNAVFWFSAFSGIIMYLVLFFFAPLIAEFYDQPILTNLSRLLFLSFVFSSMGIAQNAFLLKNIMAKQRSMIDLTSVFCSGSIGFILAINGYAFWGLAIQYVSQSAISTILRWYFSAWRPTLHIDLTPLKDMFSFGIKMFLTNVISQVTANILSVIFGRFYGEKQTGYYAQGNKWSSLGITVLNGMFVGISQPILVEAIDDKERLVHIFRKMIRFGAFISFPCMFGLAFIGREFLLITVGEKYLDSLYFLQIFSFWGGFSFLWVLYTNLLLSLGKSNIYMWGMLLISIVQIVIVSCIFPFGIKIMTLAFISCYLLGILFWHFQASKIMKIRLSYVIKDILPYFLITLFAIFVAWLVSFKIESMYIAICLKVIIVALLYTFILHKSSSVIFNESLGYIKMMISRKR